MINFQAIASSQRIRLEANLHGDSIHPSACLEFSKPDRIDRLVRGRRARSGRAILKVEVSYDFINAREHLVLWTLVN